MKVLTLRANTFTHYRMRLFKFIFCIIAITFLCPDTARTAPTKRFTVVIDAGHGGKDPGAIGKKSKEKNINLKVALALGKLIEDNCKDTKVIYTRKKDVFIGLARRAEIANEAKADLFISIHTNSVGGSKQVKGASTWTLGLAKTAENLAVAKRENEIILYEDDYQQKYAGFNPNSSESYIIFELIQDQYMEQSVHFASLIQKSFKNTAKRVDKGVHQAGFLVLKACAMPSVLVELGFISTPEEENYLNSAAGTAALSKSIYKAFLSYKNEHLARFDTGRNDNAPLLAKNDSKPQRIESAVSDGNPVFKIQILTSSSPLKKNDKRLKGITDIDYYKENGIYKYTYMESEDYSKIYSERKKILTKFKDAFIVAFKNGERMDINEAIKQYKSNKK